MIQSDTTSQKKCNFEDEPMKNVPISRVNYLQILYSAARSKPGCDVVEVKSGGNLPKVVDSVHKQYFTPI